MSPMDYHTDSIYVINNEKELYAFKLTRKRQGRFCLHLDLCRCPKLDISTNLSFQVVRKSR